MTGGAARGRLASPAVVAAALLIAACSGESGMVCEDRSRYADAGTAPPLRIPDDLSVPDESEALSIPAAAATEPDGDDAGCLEAPPPFFDGGAP